MTGSDNWVQDIKIVFQKSSKAVIEGNIDGKKTRGRPRQKMLVWMIVESVMES